MRVVFLTRRFFPDIGGVEKHVLEIGKLLVRDGHKVLVITESAGDEREIEGIEIKRIKAPDNWFKKFYIWAWLFKKRRYLKAADIIHAHDVYYWYIPFRFIYPTKPNYITFHGYENYPINNRTILVRKISQKLSNGNIAVGKFIEKWYGTKSNFIINGGVNVPKKILSAKNKLSAVFIGRLEENTGIRDYVKAVRQIKKKFPEFKFTIIGDGILKPNFTDFPVLKPMSNFDKYLREANFLFASGYLTILEGLANKRAVFSVYDNPLKKDYLKLTTFEKFINISESVDVLINNIEAQIMKSNKQSIEAGYDWVKDQTWENLYKVYLKLWNSK